MPLQEDIIRELQQRPGIPTGGGTGTRLTKLSGADGDVDWVSELGQHYGYYSGTTDTNGELTFNHGAPFTPGAIFIQQIWVGSGNNTCSLFNMTETEITVRYIKPDGANLSATAVTGFFLVLS